MTGNRSYRVFADDWIDNYGRLIHRFDVACHVLVSLAKDFNDDGMFNEEEQGHITMDVNSYVNIMGKTQGTSGTREFGRFGFYLSMLEVWDGMVPVNITWDDHSADHTQIMEVGGSDFHHYRDMLRKVLTHRSTTDIIADEQIVRDFVAFLEQFGVKIHASMADSGAEGIDDLLERTKADFLKPPGRQLIHLGLTPGKGQPEKKGFNPVWLVAVALVLAFLLAY